jgi:hypothetical protein
MSAGSLFYPPSPAQGDGSLTTHSSAIRVSKYLYSDSSMDAHTGASGQPSQGLLNGYMSVPLASPLDRADLDENNAPVEQVIKATPSKHPRLLSLDCFRGLTIAWMIQSDEGGDAWTHTCDHSPWNGLHFADFVFPAFVFIVGMAGQFS